MADSRATRPLHDGDTPVLENWCFTQLNAVKYSCTWTINNFRLCTPEIYDKLQSSTFTTGASVKSKWCLCLYPRVYSNVTAQYLALYLELLESSNENRVLANIKFSILNAEGEQTNAMGTQKTNSLFPGNAFGFSPFIARNVLLNEKISLLPEDKLTIFCEIEVLGGSIKVSGPSDVTQVKVPACRVLDDLEALFDNEIFTDVTLAVGCKEIQAHKAILAARSPVFAAMFGHEMEERKRNRVDIADVDHDVLREMLRFMYTGRAPNLDNMAGDLLAVAEKYALERLKALCEEALCRRLSAETAAATLVLADLHSADQLKKKTIDFINSGHALDVIDTAGWKTVISSHPHLLAEAFEALAIHQLQSHC